MDGDGPVIFDVEATWTFPPLGRRVVPRGGTVDVETTRASSVEYDTAAGDLASAGVRLVLADGTWTLTAGEDTLTLAAEGRAVPAEVRDLLLGVRAGAALRPAKRLDRERTAHLVRDPDGTQLGEIADVIEREATGGTTAQVSERRRVEVSGWHGPFPAAAAKTLTRAGAVRAADASGATGRRQDAGTDTVGAVLRAELAAQRRELLAGDLALRRGRTAVHRTRIAIRRIRSVLRVVPVADPDRTAELDAELRWLAAALGEVRDREVLRDHLHETVERARGDAVLADAVALVDRVLEQEHTAAQAALARTLAGRRYLALLRTLRAWSEDPPFTGGSGRKADAPAGRIHRYVRKAERKLERRLRDASDDTDLHAARKAAKRVRYAADLYPSTAAAGKRAKALQQDLGDHQDSVIAAEFLARVGAGASGAAAFGCGVLWAKEQRRARRSARVRATS